MINKKKLSAIFFLVLNFFFFYHTIEAQQIATQPFYFEFHTALQDNFGPSENHAEIMGGYNPGSYDKKNHLITGFRECFVPEIVVGYRKKQLILQSVIAYFKQDIVFIQNLGETEYPFLLTNTLSIKASASYQLSNSEKKGVYGLYSGFFIGAIMPTSYTLNKQTKVEFGFDNFSPATQFNWGMDINYNLRLGKKGLYGLAGTSLTFPGIIGSIGTIELLPTSSYTIVKDQIKMYSINYFCGIGFQPKSK